MPLIEELPVSHNARTSHGWAYVPDIGAPIAAVQPGTRKRGTAREAGGIRNDTTLKQQKAIQARLEKLDEDNYKKAEVAIPPRAKDRNKKIMSNVRRILASDRQFKHYHDAQVAELSQSGTTTVALPAPPLERHDLKRRDVGAAGTPSRRAPSQQLPMHPPPLPQTPRTAQQSPSTVEQEASSKSSMPPPPSPSHISAQPASDQATDQPTDPLLTTRDIPKMPSKRVMEALLAEPPLSYDAAAAKPLDERKKMPVRYFCGVCGYWGKVRCRRCGERTCGLMDCWKGHEAVCPIPY